jgi:hypothetical protein
VSRPETDAAGFAQVEELTRAARDAAEAGRWDEVAAHYARRGEQCAERPLSRQDGAPLLEIDREVQGRIRVAQIALMAMIQESGMALQRLNGWSQRLGGPASERGMLLLKA